MADKEQEIKTLIEGCKKNDRERQQRLYQHFYAYAMSVCLRYSGNMEEAQEILNDGFMKVFKKIDLYDPAKPFKGWLRRIMINTALDYYRKNLKHNRNEDLDRAEGVFGGEDVMDQMSYQEIMSLVQKLSPMYRAVFSLYAIDGYNHEEIASELGISVGTSKSNLFKARNNLKNMLQIHHKEAFARFAS